MKTNRLIFLIILILILPSIVFAKPYPIDTDAELCDNNNVPITMDIQTYLNIVNAFVEYGINEDAAILLANEIWDYFYLKHNMPDIGIDVNSIDVVITNIKDGVNTNEKVINIHVTIKWIDKSGGVGDGQTIFSIEFDLELTINISVIHTPEPTQPTDNNNTNNQQPTTTKFGVMFGVNAGFSLISGTWTANAGLFGYYNVGSLFGLHFAIGFNIGIGQQVSIAITPALFFNINNMLATSIGVNIGTIMGVFISFDIKI